MANEEQTKHWNSDQAGHWITHQQRYDAMLAPFGERLLAAAHVASTDRVLDVGCGCGATTLAAGRSAVTGTATGLDLSIPMLEVGRRRAVEEDLANVTFLDGDAQTYPFRASAFDAAISRFGIMFFDDPKAAFRNLAAAVAPWGRLAFVCWQDMLSNPWMAVPGLAIAEQVGLPDLGPPGRPGMFSLADPEDIRALLDAAGFLEVVVDPMAEEILLGGGGSLDDAVDFLRHGSMGRTVLAGMDEATRGRALQAVTDALAPYVTGEGVRIGTAAWLVTARRS